MKNLEKMLVERTTQVLTQTDLIEEFKQYKMQAREGMDSASQKSLVNQGKTEQSERLVIRNPVPVPKKPRKINNNFRKNSQMAEGIVGTLGRLKDL
jgi:hypothetical protein